MGRGAKELCAMLITRSLANLTEEEEDIVVDYLEDLGISVDIDTHPKDLCITLLDKTMQKDIGRSVPLTAYSNKIMDKQKSVREEKEKKDNERRLLQDRERIERNLKLREKSLPGCIPEENINQNQSYSLIVNQELGIEVLPDNNLQYSAVISVPSNLYQNIYNKLSSPIIEFTSGKGKKGYARIKDYHAGEDIYISPLVGRILDIDNIGEAILRVCSYLPEIHFVNFTYYGSKEELDQMLPLLVKKLPKVINAFSYLSLGMVLRTMIDGKEVSIRVDNLEDEEKMPIFAGVLPFGDSDLKFDIEADN